jgi:hypothetical protein
MLSYGPWGALVHIVNLMIAGFKDVHNCFTSSSLRIGLPMVCNTAKNDHSFVRFL